MIIEFLEAPVLPADGGFERPDKRYYYCYCYYYSFYYNYNYYYFYYYFFTTRCCFIRILCTPPKVDGVGSNPS